jgi:hypothetical protein
MSHEKVSDVPTKSCGNLFMDSQAAVCVPKEQRCGFLMFVFILKAQVQGSIILSAVAGCKLVSCAALTEALLISSFAPMGCYESHVGPLFTFAACENNYF